MPVHRPIEVPQDHEGHALAPACVNPRLERRSLAGELPAVTAHRVLEAFREAARLEVDIEQAKDSSVPKDRQIDAPPQLVARTRTDPEGRVVAPDHPVEPSLAHREPVVDVVVARVVAPREMEVVVAGRKDPYGGARPVDLLEGDDVRVEVARVAGERVVVVLAPGDRAAPQRPAGPPVQQVEVPARDPDPSGRQGQRPAGVRFRLRRPSRGGRAPIVPAFFAPRRAARAVGPCPMAMAGAARPIVVAAVRREPAGMSAPRTRERRQRARDHHRGRPDPRRPGEVAQPYLKRSERAFM